MPNTTAYTALEEALRDAELLGANVEEDTLALYVQDYLPRHSLGELADMLVKHAQDLMLDPFDMDAQVQLNATKRQIITYQPPF